MDILIGQSAAAQNITWPCYHARDISACIQLLRKFVNDHWNDLSNTNSFFHKIKWKSLSHWFGWLLRLTVKTGFVMNRRTKVPKIISMKFCRIIKILINHYFTWFLSTCKQLQPCLVPGCLLVINYKSRYSRRHSHKRRNNYTSNGILFTLANNKNSNLRETEPRSLAIASCKKKTHCLPRQFRLVWYLNFLCCSHVLVQVAAADQYQ